MAHNEAYKLAEEKITEAINSGSKELDLSTECVPLNGQELNEILESLGRAVNLEVLNLSGNQLFELPASLHQHPASAITPITGAGLCLETDFGNRRQNFAATRAEESRIDVIPRAGTKAICCSQ
jgi:hypothetical protein